jgi:hypothetical protein
VVAEAEHLELVLADGSPVGLKRGVATQGRHAAQYVI